MTVPGADTPHPCWNCGYDLRGSIGAVCPECGSPKRAAPSGRSGSGKYLPVHEADLLNDLRIATLGTLVLWGGVTFLPVLGQLAWVVLAIVALWRFISLVRLSRLAGPSGAVGSQVTRMLVRIALAEAIVGALVAGLTFIASMGNSATPTVITLGLLRVAWVALDAIVTFEVSRLAASAVRTRDPQALPAWWQGASMAMLCAPITMILTLAASVVTAIARGSIPQWILTTVTLVALLGCVAGVAGVIACRRALGVAARLRLADLSERDEPPQLPRRQRPAPTAQPEPDPPKNLDGVIPFADEEPEN